MLVRSATCAALLLLCTAVRAQEPSAEQEPETVGTIPLDSEPQPASSPEVEEESVLLETITTIATHTPRGSLEVPASVSVVTAQEIEERQLSDLGEALGGLAGISISGGPRVNGEAINIRGLSGTRVLMSVDGARQNFDGAHRSRLYVDPELLKSVDVLRGPASALWGSDALAGVVALETKDAADLLRRDERLGLRLKTGFEESNGEQLGGGTLFGLAGNVDWLAHYSSRSTDDVRAGGGTLIPHSALDTRSGLYKAGWRPAGPHQLGVSFQNFFQSGESPSNPSQEVSATNPLLARKNNQDYLTARYGYTGEGRLGGAQVLAYRTALGIVEDRVDAPRHDTLDFVTEGLSGHASLRFAPLAQRLTLGFEGYRDASKAERNGAPRSQFPDAQREVFGVFLQDELGLGHGWSLIPGLRYDRVRARSNTDAARETDEDQVSLKLGAAYDFTDWLSVHAGYGEAFRAPSLLETYAAGTHFLGNEFRPNPALRPERAANIEAGLRLGFRDGLLDEDQLLFKATVYDNDIADYIETLVVVETEFPSAQCESLTPPPGCVNRNENGTANPLVPPVYVGGYTTSENLRNARIRGYELETSYEIAGLAFAANFSHARGEDSSTGAPLLSIPADTLNSVLSYRWGDIRLGARVTHAAAQNRVPLDNEGNPAIPRTPSYTVTDVFLSWAPASPDGLKLNLGVDNVTDRRYRNHLAPLPDSGINPRASLSYQF